MASKMVVNTFTHDGATVNIQFIWSVDREKTE